MNVFLCPLPFAALSLSFYLRALHPPPPVSSTSQFVLSSSFPFYPRMERRGNRIVPSEAYVVICEVLYHSPVLQEVWLGSIVNVRLLVRS